MHSFTFKINNLIMKLLQQSFVVILGFFQKKMTFLPQKNISLRTLVLFALWEEIVTPIVDF
jgi:hypothetical protein